MLDMFITIYVTAPVTRQVQVTPTRLNLCHSQEIALSLGEMPDCPITYAIPYGTI